MMPQKEWLPKLSSLASAMQWEAFESMLSYHINTHQTKLEQASDIADLYRAQGAIQALRSLRYLKEEIQYATR